MRKYKRKGAYEWEREWHQNHSALIVPRVAFEYQVHDAPIMSVLLEYLKTDPMLFMLRAKVNKGSRLVLHVDGIDIPQSRTTRYHVANRGGQLIKIMPPLKGKTEDRRFDICKGAKVQPCNDIRHARLNDINLSWYEAEVEKLCLIL